MKNSGDKLLHWAHVFYGIRLSYIFKIYLGISNEKLSISIKTPSISIKILGIWIKNSEIPDFSHLEFEILGISETWDFD